MALYELSEDQRAWIRRKAAFDGKQFTDRLGRGGRRLFDKIRRRNGITHRLTARSSPNQNGAAKRFPGTFRPDFLDQAKRQSTSSRKNLFQNLCTWLDDGMKCVLGPEGSTRTNAEAASVNIRGRR